MGYRANFWSPNLGTGPSPTRASTIINSKSENPALEWAGTRVFGVRHMPDPFFTNRAGAKWTIQGRLFVDLEKRIEALARQARSVLTVWQAAGDPPLGDFPLANVQTALA